MGIYMYSTQPDLDPSRPESAPRQSVQRTSRPPEIRVPFPLHCCVDDCPLSHVPAGADAPVQPLETAAQTVILSTFYEVRQSR